MGYRLTAWWMRLGGMWLGDVVYGYDCDYTKDGGNGLAYPNEEEVEGVRLAFRKYATGSYSYRDVAEILNQAGYRPRGRGDRALSRFTKDTVNVLLTKRFYIGEVEYRGEHYPGLHEPIVRLAGRRRSPIRLSELDAKALALGGGEPTLYPRLPRVLPAAQERGLATGLTRSR